MEDSLEEGESQSNSVKSSLLFEDEGTASHCDLKKMEKQGDKSEADQNVLQNESEIVPECIQDNSGTKLSDGGSGGDCSSEGGMMSECANENREKGKGIESIHDGENIQSEADGEDNEVDEPETSSETLDVAKENDDSNENWDIFEGVREVIGSHSATHEGESDVDENNEEKAAENTFHVGDESNMNSDSGGFENEENNQNMSSFILESDENEEDSKSMNISGSEGDDNREDTQNMNSFDSSVGDNDISLYLSSSPEMEVSKNEETRQTVNNSVIEGGENEEASQAINSSSLDDIENEDVSQSTIKSDLQDNENRENNQSMSSSGLESEENEENSQVMCNSGMESNENENCQVVTGSVMEGSGNVNTLIRMEEGNRMEVVNENSSEIKHNMTFPDGEKDNSVLNEEDTQESNKEGNTEEESDIETKNNANSYVIQEQLEDFAKETQGCLGAKESRLKDTQEHSMKRSLVEEEKIAESDNSVQNPEISEQQEQDLRIMTEEKEKDTELAIESRRKEKEEEVQSEAEQEGMETEGYRVEGEEQGESKGVTIQGKDEENKTPTDAENDKFCEKEQLEKEERYIDVQEINVNKENDKTQKSVDKELEQSNRRDAATEESDIGRGKDWITTVDHDEPDKDAHHLDQLNMNEQSLKLTNETKSKPQQEKIDTDMHEVTLSEDVQNQAGAEEITGKNTDQHEGVNVTKDMLNQVDKHRIAGKDVSVKADTSQESTQEEISQNPNEEIGSESQEIKKNEISCRSREEENISEKVMVQQSGTTNQATEKMDEVMVVCQNTSTSQVSKESEHPGGETSSKCDNSRTVKHKDTVTAASACKKKLSSSCSENTVTGKMSPGQQNIAKKSFSKKTPRAAVYRQQPSTLKTWSEEQNAEDSDDLDIVVLSETIKKPVNPIKFAGITLVCNTCHYLWNDEVLNAIFDGNKSVTVNSKITYGAIMCFSSYADVHYPQNKEKAVRNVLERADLGKNIGNMKIQEVVEWLRYLMRTGSVTCCTVFDAVYNPKTADVMLSALLSTEPASQKENETWKSKQQSASKVKGKTPKSQSSCTSKKKHRAGASSRITTLSTNTTSAKKITPSQLSEAKKVQGTNVRGNSSTQPKKLTTTLEKQDMHPSETSVTSPMDDSQSLNKNHVIKECSVYLGKPVAISSQQRICSPVSSSSDRSSATKRPLTEEEDKMLQSRKKGKSLRRSLSHEESTDTNSSSESSVKDAVELPLNENSTTDLSSEYASKGSFKDSDENNTMSEWSESNLDASENEESSLEHSSDIVTMKSSNHLADKKSMTESEQSTAKVKEDIGEKDQMKAEGNRKGKTKLDDRSEAVARHNNKDIKCSNRKEKIGKTNSKDAEDQTLAHKSEASPDDAVSNIIKSQDHSRDTEEYDLQRINRNEEAEKTMTNDTEVRKHEKWERNKEANKTNAGTERCEKNEKSGDVNTDEETEKHDKNKETEKRNMKEKNEKTGDVNTDETTKKLDKNEETEIKNMKEKNGKTGDVNTDEDTIKYDKNKETEKRNMQDAKAGHEKHDRNEEDMEDAEIERHERSEDFITKDTDIKRHDKTKKIGEINMIDDEQVVSTVESVGNTAEHEDLGEKVKRHDRKNIELLSGNTESEDANMKDAKEQTVIEKQDISSGILSGNGFTNQVKRSAEGSSTHSSKRQKLSDEAREKSPGDTQTQETKNLTEVVEGVPSELQRRTRARIETQRLCSTDSKESESSMPASFEGMENSPSSELSPNCESSDESDENTSKPRLVSKEKTEEKILKSPRVLRSRSQRAVSKKFVSSSETSSDSNDQPMSTDDSVPQSRTCIDYQPVASAKSNEESENILVQKLGLNISAIDLYCNTTDSKMPTNRDMANIPRQRGRLSKALEAMLRERSNLDGVAKEAFDLLPYEHHNIIGPANNKERYLTNQELLVLQNICVLNPEAPDVDMFYQILIQVLLARRQVLLVPNSLALLVVAEKVRREFNRAKRKGNHSEYLAQDWDPCKIYTTEDFWLAEKKPPKVPTVRTVLSIFCLWKNLEKRVPISLPIALEELCRNLVLWDVDKIGICVKLYSRYCTFLYEEKNPSLAEIFLNQPFIGSKTKLQKKLLYSKEDNSKDNSGNISSKHNMNVTENDVQALLKQCLEAEEAALRSSHPREEEWFRKCVQALKDKVDAYKKEIQLIQKVTKDTEKKKFQLLSKLNSSEYEDLPQDLGKTTETLYRLLAKRTTKFEMLKEAEYTAAKETNKVPRLSPSVLKVVDLGEDVSESMKELVYELLLNEVDVEEMRPVLCTIVENMTNDNLSAVPSNSWIRNFARITGLKVKPRNNIVL
ncbi:kinesin-related protein 4-like [Scylla paramamosain]